MIPATRRATRILFLVTGVTSATWAALVPYAKLRAGLGDGELGLLLLGLGAGSTFVMPLSGALAARFGCRTILLAAGTIVAACLPALAILSQPAALLAVLAIFGAGIGALDATMNIQAILVERANARPLMSGFHGAYSLGGIAGAIGMAGLLALGVPPAPATLLVSLLALGALLAAAPDLLRHAPPAAGPVFAIPRGAILVIGLLCFVLFLAEGAVLDWSAVFLTTIRGLRPDLAGLGYAAFALAMTIVRLSGDRLVERLGRSRVITLGALCAALGFAVTTAIASWQVALLGYALVGVGCANIVPLLFSAAGERAVPAIATLGYAGILAGPAAIGLIAHLTTLPTAFLILAALLLAVAVAGRTLVREGTGPSWNRP